MSRRRRDPIPRTPSAEDRLVEQSAKMPADQIVPAPAGPMSVRAQRELGGIVYDLETERRLADANGYDFDPQTREWLRRGA